MKKVLSLFLSILIIATCCLPAGAVSISAGMSALQSTFTNGDAINFDYVMYSPVKSKGDKTKYPLIIWLHGQFSSVYERHQLYGYDIALWAADENQAKIKGTGGAFLFLPRDPNIDIAWSGESAKLKQDIDHFVNKYAANIDTDRIYIGGLSMGGRGAYRIAAQYPDYFAALYLISPVYNPSDVELRALRNTPVWMISCKYDYLVSHTTMTNAWNYLNQYSAEPHKNRWALFNTTHMVYSNGIPIIEPIYWTHDTWTAACADLFMDDHTPYKNINVINGNGYEVKLKYPDGLLSWLSSHGYNESTKPEEDDKPGSSGGNFKPLVGNIFQKIFELFRRMIAIIMG
jgi:poly(3-hydroxybutyrate) depolymerase